MPGPDAAEFPGDYAEQGTLVAPVTTGGGASGWGLGDCPLDLGAGPFSAGVGASSGAGTANDWDFAWGVAAVGLADGGVTLWAAAGGYVHVPLLGCTDNATGLPVTTAAGYPVQIALTVAEPTESDWQVAQWTAAATGPVARLPVAPDQLAPGTLGVWVRTQGQESFVGILFVR